ncbi:MAG: hypothetical protein ACP5N6_15260, partial [Anaerolineae bacterium]
MTVYTPSTLINMVIAIVRASPQALSPDKLPLLLVFWSGRGGGKTTLLHRLQDRLADIADVWLAGLWDVHTGSWKDLASQILDVFQQAPDGRHKLLLLDNLDALLRADGGEPFFAFEHQVLRELVGRGDTLVIATSRAPLIQWREYDIRIAVQNHHIPPLSREEVADWARARGLDPERAFALSLGHPQVLAWLEEQPDLPPEEIDRRVAALFLEGLPEKTRQMAEVVSLFPAFDLAVLRPLLSGEEDTESFYGEYTERLEELMGAGLVAWDGEVGAYRFREGTVRRLLARGLRRRDPGRFSHIHRVAADYYRQEAMRATYLHRTLLSALYHTAWANSGEACVRWVEDTLGMWMSAPWEKVLIAWQTGAGDEATREELRELIGPDAFERITRLL